MKNKKFYYIWSALKKKYPEWDKDHLRRATIYIIRSKKGTL